MHIDITLKYKESYAGSKKLIETIRKCGNVNYLVKGIDNPDYPYLSEVEIDDYSVFDSNDMDGIIKELKLVSKEVTEAADKVHIEEIIELAKQCKETPGTVLVFSGL